MANILQTILRLLGVKDSSVGGIIEAAQEKIEDGTLGEALEKVGIGKGEKVGELATSVINIINVAKSVLAKEEATDDGEPDPDEEEVTEEEVEGTEEAEEE